MYTILMKSDKSLVATNRVTIYQRENLVDKLQFIIPSTYNDIDLTDESYQIVLKYTDQANVPHMEFLEKDEELYKENYIRCTMPIGIELTKFAGDITLYISIMDINIEDTIKAEILHTSGITVTVEPLDDIYGFAPSESFQKIDQKILELQAALKANTLLAESIDKNKADDLSYEDNTLSLMANGQKIGTSYKLSQDEMEIIEFDNDGDSSDDTDDQSNRVVEF